MANLVAAIGDVHGCTNEAKTLIDKLHDYAGSNSIKFVFLGDILDKNPNWSECLKWIKSLPNTQCVMGNHDERHIRYRKHEILRQNTGKKNPMKMSEIDQENHNNLTQDDIAWLSNLPLKLEIAPHLWAVHAGCEIGRKSIDNQIQEWLLRLRYVNEKGFGLTLRQDLKKPDNAIYWTEKWTLPERIVYGHIVNSLSDPRIDHPNQQNVCYGIDTGCVYGGKLTATVFDESNGEFLDFVQVQAEKEYTPFVIY